MNCIGNIQDILFPIKVTNYSLKKFNLIKLRNNSILVTDKISKPIYINRPEVMRWVA